MAQRIAVDDSFKKYITFIAVLLVALIAMLFFYFMLTKPPVSKQAKKQDDFKPLFSIYGFEGDLLRRPSSVALDAQSRILVADTGKQRIVVFDEGGNYVTQFTDIGEGKYKYKDPIGVTVAPDGRVFVLSKTSKKIVIYDAQYKPIHEINFSEAPLSMTISNQKLYATTVRGVMVGDLNGNLITTFGKRGKGVGEFDLPGGIVVGSNGNIYVADSLNYRVQAFNKDGDPLWQYGSPVPADKAVMYKGKDRKFGLPASITLDDSGHLYVVDGLSSELVILNTKGEEIDKIGDIGHDDGFFYYPAGISYAGQGKMVLADKFNDRVQVFQVPLSTPATAQVFDWLPYLLLLLLPAGLLLLRRSQLQVIASEGFVREAFKSGSTEELGRAFKKLIVVPETFEGIKEEIPNKLTITSKTASKKALESVSQAKGLSAADMAALALARSAKGKKVLLVSSPALKDEAERLNLATVSYAEFETLYKAAETSRPKADPEATADAKSAGEGA